MSEYNIEKNREILKDAIKKLGKKRLPFEEKEIDALAASKTFDLVDYLKKVMIADDVLSMDKDLNIEYKMKDEYEELLKERIDLEDLNDNLSNNKRYKNIKSKTDYGFSFYAMQSFLTPKKLNEIAKNNPEVEYKYDNEIDRRSRLSSFFKKDRKRAVANATVNLFREKFPKSKNTLTTNTLCLDSDGMTVSKIAAKTIGHLCEKGVLSDFVLKVSTRLDMFGEQTGLKNITGNIFKHAGNAMKYAASAAVVAFVGAEALDMLSTPMPPIADLGIKETLELFAAVDTSGLHEIKDTLLNNDVMQVKPINVEALNVGLDGVALPVDSTPSDDAIMNFIKDHQSVSTHMTIKGDTLTNIATEHLGANATDSEVNKFVAAMSEFNDIENPNMILENQDIQIPTNEFVDNFEVQTFEIDYSNKKEILNQMKDVTIHYGETKSELVEKLVEGARESGSFKAQQIDSFKETLNDIIPTDLKAFDETVSESIKNSVTDLEKLVNKSRLRLR